MATVITDIENTSITTKSLEVTQKETSVKWDPSKRHPDVNMLEAAATARLTSNKSGPKGVLANTGYVIGTDTAILEYKINIGGSILVGVALATRDLSTVEAGDDLVSIPLTVTDNTIVTMTITTTELKVAYGDTTYTKSLTPLDTETAFPWLSDAATDGSGYSVSLSKISGVKITIEKSGTVIIDTRDAEGVGRDIRFITSNKNAFILPQVGALGSTVENPVNGMLAYDTTNNALVFYNDTEWGIVNYSTP